MIFHHPISQYRLNSQSSAIPISIFINAPITIALSINNSVLFTGPLGQASLDLNGILLNVKDNTLFLDSLHKNLKFIIANIRALEQGLSIGHKRILLQSGVWIQGVFTDSKVLTFNLGLSHPVSLPIPQHLLIKTFKEQQERTLSLFSISKDLTTTTADAIYNLKPPEPYKGTGFRYKGQFLTRKVGKKK